MWQDNRIVQVYDDYIQIQMLHHDGRNTYVFTGVNVKTFADDTLIEIIDEMRLDYEEEDSREELENILLDNI